MSPWSKQTRDAWFFGALALSTLAMGWLFLPYLYDMIFAGVLVVVTWPVYQRILGWCRGKKIVATFLTMLTLGIVVFVPVGVVLGLAIQDAIALVQRGIAFIQEGTMEDWATRLTDLRNHPSLAFALPVLDRLLPPEQDLLATIGGPLQQGALATLNAVGSSVPALVQAAVNLGLDGLIFMFTAATLYMEGPRFLSVVKNLSPMDDAYEEHLFTVFRQFANNIVLGSLVTSAVQGAVASLGYLIAGADRVIFLGILTAVFSFVPMLGAAGVGVGVGAYVAITVSPGWGLFVVGWSLIVTGTVDNVLKPLLLRGGSDIHPLLIFLSVFGGLGWMGVPGLLVGPVIVAFFLALYTIYVHDYVGVPAAEAGPAPTAPAEAPTPDAPVTSPTAPAPPAPERLPEAAPPPADQAPVTTPGSSGDGK